MIWVMSSERPHHVEWMARHSPDLSWMVPRGQAHAYRSFGASRVEEVDAVPPCKAIQANAALDLAWAKHEYAVLIDDDLVKVEEVDLAELRPHPSTLGAAVRRVQSALDETGLWLGGAANGTNLLWRKGLPPVRTYGALFGGMTVHRRGSEVRYDTRAEPNEDVDLCVAHHLRYGGAAIVQDLRLSFIDEHSKHAVGGGFTSIRTPERTTTVVNYLNDKWGTTGARWTISERGTPQQWVPWRRISR